MHISFTFLVFSPIFITLKPLCCILDPKDCDSYPKAKFFLITGPPKCADPWSHMPLCHDPDNLFVCELVCLSICPYSCFELLTLYRQTCLKVISNNTNIDTTHKKDILFSTQTCDESLFITIVCAWLTRGSGLNPGSNATCGRRKVGKDTPNNT